MILIQDIFNEGLTESIRLNTHLLDINGLIQSPDVILDNLLFSCCTRNEFVTVVQARMAENKKFPFIFIESGDNITYEVTKDYNKVVIIKEIHLCTLTNKELLADEKERAEHLMLVDLGRNDIGRISEFGKVEVNQLIVFRELPNTQAHYKHSHDRFLH